MKLLIYEINKSKKKKVNLGGGQFWHSTFKMKKLCNSSFLIMEVMLQLKVILTFS